ncbi:transcriptional regulator with XRE-family HTH domain [Kroppenstedtia sanguinis]|uniref:Helix-turn-helix domain-containing protein n=1 Tax=Kroppenstedtia sanguinis TaxID=1380684 RepID=A0ABW4C6J8_9BACL
MRILGLRLRTLRLEKKMRQEDLAREIGISKSAVGMYERGEREPSLNLLTEIADFFRVSADFLLGRSDRASLLSHPRQDSDPPGTDGNLKNFLTRKDLHWEYIPLANKELRAVKELMEVVVRERSAHYEVNPNQMRKADRKGLKE